MRPQPSRPRSLPWGIVFALGAAAVLSLAACGKEEPVAEAPVVRPVKLLTVGSEASEDARSTPLRRAAHGAGPVAATPRPDP